MIASIWFDDMIVVRGGASGGAEMPLDLRESSFHHADGWDIVETAPDSGIFLLRRDGMRAPVKVGGYGYSYVEAGQPEPKKGKR